jgi:hypothetical protein
MTIVAVNGGGNTPQGVQLERCFVKSWSTSGDADGTNDSFIFADYKPTESLAVDPTNPNVDLRPMETPGPDDNVGLPAVQMGDGLLMPPSNIGGVSVGCGDVNFADYKPTESLAVDPTNPNVDLRLLETPGPDDNVGLPAVQMGDGLLMPPSNIGGVSVGCGDVDGAADALGDPVTFTFTVSVDPSAYEGSHLLYQDVFVPPSETGSAVAMEALTIAHEGFWLI